MIRQICRNGSSLTVALPAAFLEVLDLVKGDSVEVRLRGQEIVIKPLSDASAPFKRDAKFCGLCANKGVLCDTCGAYLNYLNR